MDAVSSDCSSGLSDGASRLKIHQQVSSPDDEEAFDPVTEHFKRSLGREYSDLIRSKSSPLSSSGAGTGTRASSSLSSPSSCGPLTPPASLGKVPLPGTASASSSVLVHNPNSSSNGNNDSCSGSNGATGPLVTTFTSVKVDVDDHFAKALGDQWKKLKAGNSGSKAAAAPASTITSKLGSQV